MFSFIFYIIIIIFIVKAILKYSINSSPAKAAYFIGANFANVSVPYKDNTLTLYLGDKAGENFIFALQNNSSFFSLHDINNLYETAERLHIHNKILITDFPVSPSILSKIEEYNIDVWNSLKLTNMFDSTSNTSYTSSTNTTVSSISVLKTSDTSDDTCEIDDNPFDPIQDGAYHTHGLFSIFKDKTEHL